MPANESAFLQPILILMCGSAMRVRPTHPSLDATQVWNSLATHIRMNGRERKYPMLNLLCGGPE